MALDTLPPPFRRLRLDALRNLAAALSAMGQLVEAAETLQAVVREGAEHQTAFNLVVCAAALRDTSLLREAFVQLLTVPPYLTEEEREAAEDTERHAGKDEAGNEASDLLSLHLVAKQSEAERYCLLAARLAAPQLGSDGGGGDWGTGYDWCGAKLVDAGMAPLAAELQVAKAVEQLWQGSGDEALATLHRLSSTVGSQDAQQRVPAVAAALTALRRLERGVEGAGKESTAGSSVLHGNTPANRVDDGNALLMAGKAEEALGAYDDALATSNRNCGSSSARGSSRRSARLQPAFNAGLACRALGASDRAHQLFSAVLSTAPATPEAALHVAELAEETGDDVGAASWLTRLLAAAPHDVGVLSRLGALHTK